MIFSRGVEDYSIVIPALLIIPKSRSFHVPRKFIPNGPARKQIDSDKSESNRGSPNRRKRTAYYSREAPRTEGYLITRGITFLSLTGAERGVLPRKPESAWLSTGNFLSCH
ncbi:uncharacterized protein LOC129730267 [Wyeomyia smithii]|uniref:uncharacterized protein LOC129730267 n=1 Tax=Wyeomyia smithii TaxID=174621 RepID=UPI002467E3EE|nr:uncharacterized protein LOC129730267 [Wyeomyia smithii]